MEGRKKKLTSRENHEHLAKCQPAGPQGENGGLQGHAFPGQHQGALQVECQFKQQHLSYFFKPPQLNCTSRELIPLPTENHSENSAENTR